MHIFFNFLASINHLHFVFELSLALRILAFFSLVHFFVEKWSNSAKTWENNEKSRNKGHLPERQKFQQNANWNKADEHIKNLRLKRSWNLYAKNVIRIQKIVLLSERYFYITVSFFTIFRSYCVLLILVQLRKKLVDFHTRQCHWQPYHRHTWNT